MRHRVYLVHGQEAGSFACLVDSPLAGCHARGLDRSTVLGALPGQIDEFLRVLSRWWDGFDADQYRPVEPEVVAEFTKRGSARDGSMHLFPEERVPPTPAEITERLQVLACTRQELISVAQRVNPSTLDVRESGMPESHTIRNQLRHVADVERWYLSRLWRGLPRLKRSNDVWQRLELTRSLVDSWLSELPGGELARLERYNGELWSVRKILRRLVYHEWFHLQVIRRIAAGAVQGDALHRQGGGR